MKRNTIGGLVKAHHTKDATAGAGAGAGAELVCPHCQVKGTVTSKTVKAKKGITGSKATGAVLTLGVSTELTGLSRKQDVTARTCSNSKTTWEV
jgi:hypothetical protein